MTIDKVRALCRSLPGVTADIKMDLRETDEHIRRSHALVCATLTSKARALIEATLRKAPQKAPTQVRRAR